MKRERKRTREKLVVLSVSYRSCPLVLCLSPALWQVDRGALPIETAAAAATTGDDGDEEDLLKQALAMSMTDGEEFENMRVRSIVPQICRVFCHQQRFKTDTCYGTVLVTSDRVFRRSDFTLFPCAGVPVFRPRGGGRGGGGVMTMKQARIKWSTYFSSASRSLFKPPTELGHRPWEKMNSQASTAPPRILPPLPLNTCITDRP